MECNHCPGCGSDDLNQAPDHGPYTCNTCGRKFQAILIDWTGRS
jgi:transcription initiation factor TFIIIB Brf1 subunit/transcription initiation factor TFIIB